MQHERTTSVCCNSGLTNKGDQHQFYLISNKFKRTNTEWRYCSKLLTVVDKLMRHALIFIVTIFTTLTVVGQTLIRQYEETAEMFANRSKPDTTELAHPVIETSIWDTDGKAIIAFYGYDDPKDVNTGFNKVFGHVYMPVGQNIYRDISFGPIEEDGGYPKIISVFFANADNDNSKELIVLCKYDQRHYDYSGEFYETFIFDNPSAGNELPYFNKLSEKFFGCECGWRDGKVKTAKYKTAKAVKAGLVNMGYK